MSGHDEQQRALGGSAVASCQRTSKWQGPIRARRFWCLYPFLAYHNQLTTLPHSRSRDNVTANLHHRCQQPPSLNFTQLLFEARYDTNHHLYNTLTFNKGLLRRCSSATMASFVTFMATASNGLGEGPVLGPAQCLWIHPTAAAIVVLYVAASIETAKQQLK